VTDALTLDRPADTTTPVRSPERAALHAAIAKHTAAARALADNESARATAAAATRNAEVAVGLARETLEQAKADAADAIATGKRPRPGTLSIAGARARLQDAEDQAEAASVAMSSLQAAAKNLPLAEVATRLGLDQRIADVVRADPGVVAALARFAALRQELWALDRLIEFLAGHGMLPPEARGWRNAPPAQQPPTSAEEFRLLSWIERLATDADADANALPGEPAATPSEAPH
jgi:hypothetical protein